MRRRRTPEKRGRQRFLTSIEKIAPIAPIASFPCAQPVYVWRYSSTRGALLRQALALLRQAFVRPWPAIVDRDDPSARCAALERDAYAFHAELSGCAAELSGEPAQPRLLS